jgi:hypothetical protein
MREVSLATAGEPGFGGHFPLKRPRTGQEPGKMAEFCVKSVEIVGKLKRLRGRGLIKIAAKPATAAAGAVVARGGLKADAEAGIAKGARRDNRTRP